MQQAAGTLRQRFAPDGPAIVAAALGGLLFLLIYGPSTLNPTYDSWIYNGYIGVDILQHYAGWAAFRDGAWAFPLSFTAQLHWPFGAVAALADCVPLFAVPFKLISGLLPETFQYFGWFGLFCMAMNGWAGARLLGLFGLPGELRTLGSVLFSAAPILLERVFQHAALGAHFLVVMALCAYFKARRGGFTRAPWGFVVLCGVAVFTHVYFVPMVLALAFACWVDSLIFHRSAKKSLPALWALLGGLACAVLCGFLLGYFEPSTYVPGGYGNFGANLNTFWNPASFNWAMWDPNYQNLDWSRFLPQLPVVGDSLGSFNYLGLGVLAGLAVGGAAALARLLKTRGAAASLRAGWQLAKTHAGLAFSCFALGVFAVSNVVTANSRVLFTVPLPAVLVRLCDTFRSSGRMLWPLYYLLVLCCVLGCAWLLPRRRRGASSVGVVGPPGAKSTRRLERYVARMRRRITARQAVTTARAAPLVLAAVLLVQGADLGGVLAEKRAYFATPVVPQSYAAPENWDKIAAKGRVLYQLELNEDRVTALRAATAGLPSNFFLAARGTPAALEADMAATRAQLLAGTLPCHSGSGPSPTDAVYITSDDALAAQLQAALAGRCPVYRLGRYTAFVALG